MSDLVHDLCRLAERNRDGSYTTQYDRKRMLMLFGRQLEKLGYRKLRATELMGRHVQKLLALWQGEGVSPGTLANRMAALRWWAERVDRSSVMAKSNAVYGVTPRQRVPAASKAKELPDDMLRRVGDAHIQMSLRLVLAFGLRRKEALLVQVHACDKGDRLELIGSMTKNGRSRTIPISTALQREVLDEARAFILQTAASMIPAHRSFIQQRRLFDYWVARIGLGGAHSLRHHWAQERYAALSGMECPHRGGPMRSEMTDAQQEADESARRIVSNEMGHNRLEIVNIYVGRNV